MERCLIKALGIDRELREASLKIKRLENGWQIGIRHCPERLPAVAQDVVVQNVEQRQTKNRERDP